MGAILTESAADHAAEWRAWHEGHERKRASKHGFLAITSIRWLTAAPERFEDAPGTWSTGDDGPVVELAPGEELEIDGRPVSGRYRFGTPSTQAGRLVYWSTPDERVAIEVTRRDGRDVVRPRHPNNPLRVGYTGTPAYEPTLRFVVDARYDRFTTPREVTVGSVVEGLHAHYDAPGRLIFDLDGPRSLIAFQAPSGGLHVLFTDRTSGVTTYPAVRSLDVAGPNAKGQVRVDFNRALNLPCAYTPYATCPLPPPENRLDVAIEAGEKWKR